jgi:hypothetical protein
MKYCRFRHLAERHAAVVDAFINTLNGTPAGAQFTDLTMMRDGGRMGVNDLEARYLEALAGDFMTWMAGLGMILQ